LEVFYVAGVGLKKIPQMGLEDIPATNQAGCPVRKERDGLGMTEAKGPERGRPEGLTMFEAKKLEIEQLERTRMIVESGLERERLAGPETREVEDHRKKGEDGFWRKRVGCLHWGGWYSP
jgi:hypothetical protein